MCELIDTLIDTINCYYLFVSKADIWALGCITYEIVLHFHPFFSTNVSKDEDGNQLTSKIEQPIAITRMIDDCKYRERESFVNESSDFQTFISRVRTCNLFILRFLILVFHN